MKLKDYFKKREAANKKKLQQEMYKFAHGKQGWMAQHGYQDSSQMTESGAWPQFKADFQKHQEKMKQLKQKEQDSKSKAKSKDKNKEDPKQRKREDEKIKSLSPQEAQKETQKAAARGVIRSVDERRHAPKNKQIYYRRKNVHGIKVGHHRLGLGPRNIASGINKHLGGYTYNSNGQKQMNSKLREFDKKHPDQGQTFAEKVAVFKKALILSFLKTNDDIFSSKLANNMSPAGMKKNLKERHERKRAKRILHPSHKKQMVKNSFGRILKTGKRIINGVHDLESEQSQNQGQNNKSDDKRKIIEAQRKRNIQHNLHNNNEDELE